MKIIIIFLLFIVVIQPINAQKVVQNCKGDDCFQYPQNTGEINIEGGKVQIGINKGTVNLTYVGDPKDKKIIEDNNLKVKHLKIQIEKHLKTIYLQEKRNLSDNEKLTKATTYANNLIKQLDRLKSRIAKLDFDNELTNNIIKARDEYNIPLLKDLLKKKQILDDKASAETAYQLAGLQKLDLEYNEALANYLKAVDRDSTNIYYLNDAGLMLIFLARNKEALILLEKATALILSTYGDAHPEVGINRINIGGVWLELGEYDKAKEYFELALASNLKTYGDEHPEIAITYNNLGGAWRALGKYKKAIKY